eukprot:TRINITY_DN10253_c0_g1_i2.p1 TRINITY_DN10253_c0_g1~~TRINITY_DN10253_c0_g1_i2.p1  ORF type:complete len:437 (+),score=76.71 TRINITY_DN10253_c0_g1_i2:77-1387(+)
MSTKTLLIAVLTKIPRLLDDVKEATKDLDIVSYDGDNHKVEIVLSPLENPRPILISAQIIIADPPLLALYTDSCNSALWIQSTFAGVDKLIRALKPEAIHDASASTAAAFPEQFSALNERIQRIERMALHETMAIRNPPQSLLCLSSAVYAMLTGDVSSSPHPWMKPCRMYNTPDFRQRLVAFQSRFLTKKVVDYVESVFLYNGDIDKTQLAKVYLPGVILKDWVSMHVSHYRHIMEENPGAAVKKSDYKFKLTRVSGIFGEAMAEYCLGNIIARERKFFELKKLQEERKWGLQGGSVYQYRKLSSLTIFLLGTGDIAKEIARSAKQGFRMKVYGFARSKKAIENFDGIHTGFDGLLTGLRQADYVINVLPSTSQTRGLLTPEILHYMNTNAVFINIGRGDVTTEKTLAEALQTRKSSVVCTRRFHHSPCIWHQLC